MPRYFESSKIITLYLRLYVYFTFDVDKDKMQTIFPALKHLRSSVDPYTALF